MKSLLLIILVVLFLYNAQVCSSKENYVQCETVKAKGAPPHERYLHTCGIYNNKMYVIGGRLAITTWTNAANVLDLENMKWSKATLEMVPSTEPIPAIGGHSMTLIGDNKYYIYGGRNNLFKANDDMYEFDPSTETLKRLKTKGPSPGGRDGHCAVSIGKKILIFGGTTKKRDVKNDIYIFDTSSNVWTKPDVKGDVPSPSQYHQCVMFGNKMYVFGGANNMKYTTDIHVLDTETMTWTKLPIQMKPRNYHSAVRIKQHVYLFGGHNTKHLLSDTQVFDLISNTFVDIPIKGEIPSERQGHCAVTHGNKIILFGGSFSWSKKYNDLYILDTTPGETAKEKEKKTVPLELSKLIEQAIVNINLILGTGTDDEDGEDLATIETELRQVLSADKDDSLLVGLPEKLKNWNSIQNLYNNLLNAKDDMKNLTNVITHNVDEIAGARTELDTKRQKLRNAVKELYTHLDELKNKEDRVKEAETRKKTAEELLAQEEAKLNTLKKEEKECEEQKSTLSSQIVRMESECALYSKNLQERNKLIDNAYDVYTNAKLQEKKLLEEIEALREELARDNSDVDNLTEEIKKLNMELTNVLRVIGTISKIMQQAQQFKQSYVEVQTHLDKFEMVKENFVQSLRQVFDEEVQTTLPKTERTKEDEIKNIDQKLISRKKEFEEKKFKLQADIERLQAELKKKSVRVQQLKLDESAKIKQLELTRRRIQQQSETRSLAEQEKDKIEQEWKNCYSNLEKTKAEKVALEIECQRKSTLVEDTTKSIKDKTSAVSEETKALDAARRELSEVRHSLRLQYDELIRIKDDYEVLKNKLDNMKREILVSKREYETQRGDVVNARKALKEKLSLVECKCEEVDAKYKTIIANLEKQIEELKKEKEKLEKQAPTITVTPVPTEPATVAI